MTPLRPLVPMLDVTISHRWSFLPSAAQATMTTFLDGRAARAFAQQGQGGAEAEAATTAAAEEEDDLALFGVQVPTLQWMHALRTRAFDRASELLLRAGRGV